MSGKTYDVAIIGAGHNGLVTATYLAKAGQKVIVVEANDHIGGAAVTREFAPGFKASGVAHILHALHPKVVSDLGLRLENTAIGTSVLLPEAKSIEISGDPTATAASIAAVSKAKSATHVLGLLPGRHAETKSNAIASSPESHQ